jgi:hypothetical protein
MLCTAPATKQLDAQSAVMSLSLNKMMRAQISFILSQPLPISCLRMVPRPALKYKHRILNAAVPGDTTEAA